jgi:hypothetical protein
VKILLLAHIAAVTALQLMKDDRRQDGEPAKDKKRLMGCRSLTGRGRGISKNSKANRIETGERSGGIGEICSVEVEEK